MKSSALAPFEDPKAPYTEPLHPHEVLIFLHLMKTGGTSLFKMLRQHYAKSETFHYGNKPGRKSQDFENLLNEKRTHVRFIHGHLKFGFHERLNQPCRYITMLREPVSRVVSLYYFLHHNPRRHIPEEARCETLHDFLEQHYITADNYQTRQVAGSVSTQFAFGECTTDLLEIAKANLAQFLCVGITERFDESLIVFRRQIGLTKILYSPFNQNSRKPKPDAIDKRDIERIKELNQLDLELYQFGNELLSQAMEHLGDSFKAEYHLFQHANQQYRSTTSHIESVKKKKRKVRHKIRHIRQSLPQLIQMKEDVQNKIDTIFRSRFFRLLQWLRIG